MITIKELANELGVSKQAVYNRVTKSPLSDKLDSIDGAKQVSEQGTIYLSDAGAEIVRKAYADKYPGTSGTLKNIGYGRTEAVRQQNFDDNRLEHLVSKVDAMQSAVKAMQGSIEVMQGSIKLFTDHLQAKDAQIETLSNSIASKDAEIGQFKGVAQTLQETIDAKDVELHAIQDKYAHTIGNLKLLHAQVVSLKGKAGVKQQEEAESNNTKPSADVAIDPTTNEPPTTDNIEPTNEQPQQLDNYIDITELTLAERVLRARGVLAEG